MEKIVPIKIDIENARKVLRVSAGSLQEEEKYIKMSDDEIVDIVIRRIRCWAIEKA